MMDQELALRPVDSRTYYEITIFNGSQNFV